MHKRRLSAPLGAISALLSIFVPQTQAASERDPAAWGSSHVGRPVPDYEDGNTCLFCHRTSIGPSWQTNRHATTIRSLVDEPNTEQLKRIAGGAEYVFGRDSQLRFLKPTGTYGAFSLLDAFWSPREKEWRGEERWDDAKFGARCSGCHASGIDSVAKTFQMPSLDCHTCHGLAVPEHTEDGTLMLLSKKGKTRAEVEISICGSCHLRGGKSKSTGLPFPNNFVPGDNLFRDFYFDLSPERLQERTPDEAHIAQSIREVAVDGNDATTCTKCHEIHKFSTERHKTLATHSICFTCHVPGKPLNQVRKFESHNVVCEY